METLILKSAIDQAAAIREQKISVGELLELQLERVDRLNPSINAIVWQDRKSARMLAKMLDEEAARGEFRGPLHGVPVTIKESFDLVGSPSTWGKPEFSENFPTADAETVISYKRAGALIFGKTNVPYLLRGWQTFNDIYGITNNPWDLTRNAGGSSGGSAAALAASLSALELG